MSTDSRQSAELRRAQGWVNFAGVMLLIAGTMNVIGGIAAIDDANIYVGEAHYVFGDLQGWGWAILITGALQALTGVGIVRRSQAARWAGVGFASLNSLAQLLMLAAYPLLSLALFAVDFIILFALLVYADPEYA